MAILGLACLAADRRDWHRAATLHGIAQALMDQTGTPWEPFDERRRQESLDQARQALGGEHLQRAYTCRRTAWVSSEALAAGALSAIRRQPPSAWTPSAPRRAG